MECLIYAILFFSMLFIKRWQNGASYTDEQENVPAASQSDKTQMIKESTGSCTLSSDLHTRVMA